MAKKDPPTAKTVSRELARIRKRVERGEGKTAELKAMVRAMEYMLDELTED